MVCMIMLILIQFDVCGYDLVRAFHLMEETSNTWIYDETTVTDADDTISEWQEPEYRSVSNRSFFKIPLMDFLPFIFIPVLSEKACECNINTSLQIKSPNLSYLRFCVLLI